MDTPGYLFYLKCMKYKLNDWKYLWLYLRWNFDGVQKWRLNDFYTDCNFKVFTHVGTFQYRLNGQNYWD